MQRATFCCIVHCPINTAKPSKNYSSVVKWSVRTLCRPHTFRDTAAIRPVPVSTVNRQPLFAHRQATAFGIVRKIHAFPSHQRTMQISRPKWPFRMQTQSHWLPPILEQRKIANRIQYFEPILFYRLTMLFVSTSTFFIFLFKLILVKHSNATVTTQRYNATIITIIA